MQIIRSLFDRSPYQLAIISGILVGCSYPPIPGVTAWIDFIPLIHIWLTQSPKESARWTFFAGVISHMIAFYWIGLNSGASLMAAFLSMVASILYLSAIWAAFGHVLFSSKMYCTSSTVARAAIEPYVIDKIRTCHN